VARERSKLHNVLERASILCEDGLIDTNHLALESSAKSLRSDTTDLSVFERTTIVKVLRDCRGNKTKAAPATWIVAHTAARADSEVPTRGSGRVTNAANTGEQEMSSTRVLRRPWAVALIILLVTGGAAPAQTKRSVDPAGYIVTNAHVVAGAQRLRVDIRLPVTGDSILAARSRTVNASIVGIDLETDLAVIKVDERNLATLPWRFRRFARRATRSGVRQPARAQQLGVARRRERGRAATRARVADGLRADRRVDQPGGPLVDLRGRIVGINTLILSQAGGSEGLGFTAPSHIVRRDEQQHHERHAHPREVKHSEPRCHRNAGGEDDGRGCNLPSQTSSADCRPPLRPAKCRRPAERVDGGPL
jgi:Trypsin-like peptidase domain